MHLYIGSMNRILEDRKPSAHRLVPRNGDSQAFIGGVGHMAPISHAALVNEAIVAHLRA
jgi:hypothetical protein